MVIFLSVLRMDTCRAASKKNKYPHTTTITGSLMVTNEAYGITLGSLTPDPDYAEISEFIKTRGQSTIENPAYNKLSTITEQDFSPGEEGGAAEVRLTRNEAYEDSRQSEPDNDSSSYTEQDFSPGEKGGAAEVRLTTNEAYEDGRQSEPDNDSSSYTEQDFSPGEKGGAAEVRLTTNEAYEDGRQSEQDLSPGEEGGAAEVRLTRNEAYEDSRQSGPDDDSSSESAYTYIHNTEADDTYEDASSF